MRLWYFGLYIDVAYRMDDYHKQQTGRQIVNRAENGRENQEFRPFDVMSEHPLMEKREKQSDNEYDDGRIAEKLSEKRLGGGPPQELLVRGDKKALHEQQGATPAQCHCVRGRYGGGDRLPD
jgi:hypothetical protein